MQMPSGEFVEHLLVEAGRAAMILAANYSGQYFAKTRKGQPVEIPTFVDKTKAYAASILFISIYLIYFLIVDGVTAGLATMFIILSASSAFGTWQQYTKEENQLNRQS